MSTERTPLSDKDLWRSLATDRVAPAAVSEMDFAAWLEGRLSEADAAGIDAAVGGPRVAPCRAGTLGYPGQAVARAAAAHGRARPGVGRLRGREACGAPLVAGRPIAGV